MRLHKIEKFDDSEMIVTTANENQVLERRKFTYNSLNVSDILEEEVLLNNMLEILSIKFGYFTY